MCYYLPIQSVYPLSQIKELACRGEFNDCHIRHLCREYKNMSDTKQKTIEEMYTAGVHVGYSRSRRHPSVTPHIYAVKNRIAVPARPTSSKTSPEKLGHPP